MLVHTYRRPNGDLVFFESRGAPVLREGEVVGLAVNTRDVTDGRLAEDALRESEKRFRSIVDATPVPVAISQVRDGRILYSNTAFAEAIGLTPDELTGRLALDFYVERKQRQTVLDALKRKGQVRDHELRCRKADGTEFWIMAAFQLMAFEGEEAVLGTFADITARKAAEAAILESERLYRESIEAAGAVPYSRNYLTNAYDFVGSGIEALTGYSADELTPDVWRSIVQEEVPRGECEGEPLAAATERARTQRGLTWTADVRIRTRDGEERWLSNSSIHIFSEGSDRSVRGLGILQDMTARKLAEEALRESEESFRALAENANDGILIAIGGGRHVYANRRAAEMSDYSVDELLETSIGDLAHPDEITKLMERFKGRLDGESVPKQYETSIVRKDGTGIPIELTAARTVWKGAPADIVVIRDTTERKRFEQELARHRDELEELVKKRTAELETAHEELVEQERLATLGTLVATVNHEMRNPLMTVKGSLFMIGERIRDKGLGVDHMLDRADRSVSRCEKIIEELLDYTRARAPDMQRTVVDVWLDSVLDEQEMPPGITLQRDLASRAQLPIDQERLRRCMVNVITNACEAMTREKGTRCSPDGEAVQGQVSVISRVVDGRLQIQVKDTGPGIPDQIRYKVLDPLFTTKSFGIGLGLPTVAETMRQHGGDVGIQSEIGAGTTVTMWLPLSELLKCPSEPSTDQGAATAEVS